MGSKIIFLYFFNKHYPCWKTRYTSDLKKLRYKNIFKIIYKDTRRCRQYNHYVLLYPDHAPYAPADELTINKSSGNSRNTIGMPIELPCLAANKRQDYGMLKP